MHLGLAVTLAILSRLHLWTHIADSRGFNDSRGVGEFRGTDSTVVCIIFGHRPVKMVTIVQSNGMFFGGMKGRNLRNVNPVVFHSLLII